MKKVLLAVLCLFIFANFATAQWVYDSDFKVGPRPHGLVIDADGIIWIGHYAYTDTIGMPTDTIRTAPIYGYNADGSLAMKVTFLTIDGVTDTLATYCRGLSLDHNGNILFTGNRVLYRINYQTGEGMNKYTYPYASGSLTSAASDAAGFTYVTKVVPGGDPIVILDEDFTLYSFVQDTCKTIQRSLLVTPDGKDVYLPRIYGGAFNNGIIHFHSDDGPDGTYAPVDTMYKEIWGQVGDWDRNGLMWIGSYWDANPGEGIDWYALDPTQDFAIVDTVGHSVGLGVKPTEGPNPPIAGTYYAPRHAAWSLDGMTMYTADFDGGVVKKWTNANPAKPGDTPLNITVGVENKGDKKYLAVDFELLQNYPNPFNPSTTIPFSLKKKGSVQLKVYDITGREVANLVNRPMEAGSHKVLFDATGLASGLYMYRLTANGQTITKSMMFVK